MTTDNRIVARIRKFSIFNFQFSTFSGFTLIEFLVVLGILVVTVGTALLVLTSVLRGSNKANINAEVKQNGQVVLDTIDKQIRGAVDAKQLLNSPEVPPGASSAISLVLASGENLYLACFDPLLPTSNGWIGTVISSALPSPAQYIPLTNRDPVEGVDVSDCNFTVIDASFGAVSPPVVSIDFTLNQGVGAPSREDFSANAQFQTTISLRNYSR